MTKIATSIERKYPEGAPPELYVFTTDTVPPRFATVEVVEAADDGYLSASGPYSKERLDVELAHSRDTAEGPPLSDYEQSVMYADATGYNVDQLELRFTGDYPGGRDQAALNLARVVLGR